MELSKNAQKIFDLVKDLSAVELSQLVKSLEEEFDVSAAAAVVAGGVAGGEAGGDEEKDSFDIEIEEIGQKKIAVIKVVKEILGVGLKDAKAKVEEAPVIIKEGVKTEDAEGLKEKLEEAGAKVNLK